MPQESTGEILREGRAARTSVSAALAPMPSPIRDLATRTMQLLRERLSGGFELVYDQSPRLFVGFGPTAAREDAVVWMTAAPKSLKLVFPKGGELLDPHQLLWGRSPMLREYQMSTEADLLRPAVYWIVDEAIRHASVPEAKWGPKRILLMAPLQLGRPY